MQYIRIGPEVWVVHQRRLLFAGTVRPWRAKIHINEYLACYPGQAERDGDCFAREISGVNLLVSRCLYLANLGRE